MDRQDHDSMPYNNALKYDILDDAWLFTTRAQREVIPKLGGPCVVT